MNAVGAVGYAWSVIRIPVSILFTIVWVYATWKRNKPSSAAIEPKSANTSADAVEEKLREHPSVALPPLKTVASPQQPPKPLKKGPKKFTRTSAPVRSPSPPSHSTPYHVFFTSQFNHTSRLATHLVPLLPSHTLHDLSKIPNLEDYFLSHPARATYLLLLPSYANDAGPTAPFLATLEDTWNDFRVDANPLGGVRFAVFGTGDREGWPTRGEYCYQAVKAEKLLEKLGAKRVLGCGMGDSKGRVPLEVQVEGWITRVLTMTNEVTTETKPGEEQVLESDDDEPVQDGLLDVEDVAKPLSRTPSSLPPKMVSPTSLTHRSLTKQGYTIVGTHSGVKICRWTKSALRGRGSCYKFSFYGIKSHLCMETTPSLACANKCVFCWRHGTNPVGTSWRWQVDPPEEVFRGALEGHYAKIRMLRGMMGVKPERYEEALRVRHCALSLVGEPIFCTLLAGGG
jgi:tRNA wybutosine-synthesizing protein 1